MAFLELEQLFAVSIAAQNDIDMPINRNSPDFEMQVMLSPTFIDAMYIDKFCEEIYNSNNYSVENQYLLANQIIEDTIRHRWVKHLKPLSTHCKEQFLEYCTDKLKSSTCIIKTLANCLSVMVAFENIYAYESIIENDPILVQKEKFSKKLKNGATIQQLINTIEPEDLRGDAIAFASIKYYEKMCQKFGKGDITKLFLKSKSFKTQQEKPTSQKNEADNNAILQKTKLTEQKSHSFSKSVAELVGGIILFIVGFSIPSGFFVAAGTIGVGKGFYSLFLSTSAAIWEKIPKPNITDKDKKKFKIMAICTAILIVWFIALLMINNSLERS